MYIVGLTGGIACGKTTVAKQLANWGVPVIDTDQLSHALTAPQGEALLPIRETFGSSVFYEDGTLNRPALGGVVFENSAQRAKLNAIMHPLIEKNLLIQLQALREANTALVVLEVPLLFEVQWQKYMDCIVCVCAPQPVQLTRIMQRDGVTEAEALARIQSQMPLAEKKAKSDVVIDTTEDTIHQQLFDLYTSWMSMV